MRIGMPRYREEGLLCSETEQRKEELTRLTVVLLDGKDARRRRKEKPLLRPLTVVRPPSSARAAGKGDRGLAARVYCFHFWSSRRVLVMEETEKEEQGEGLARPPAKRRRAAQLPPSEKERAGTLVTASRWATHAGGRGSLRAAGAREWTQRRGRGQMHLG
jgi:hypothetical protein